MFQTTFIRLQQHQNTKQNKKTNGSLKKFQLKQPNRNKTELPLHVTFRTGNTHPVRRWKRPSFGEDENQIHNRSSTQDEIEHSGNRDESAGPEHIGIPYK